jgi:hypothetical protein
MSDDGLFESTQSLRRSVASPWATASYRLSAVTSTVSHAAQVLDRDVAGSDGTFYSKATMKRLAIGYLISALPQRSR